MQGFHPPRPPHHRPPHPPAPQGYLLQRILCCEKRCLPGVCADWCFEGCDAHAVQSVSAAGTPVWTAENGCTLLITVPLNVRLCDPCGRACAKPASIEVETHLPAHFAESLHDPRSTLLILPCVRLIRAECACGGCFRVQLHVSLEICLLRYEICRTGPCRPECPQLPLYPPPMC